MNEEEGGLEQAAGDFTDAYCHFNVKDEVWGRCRFNGLENEPEADLLLWCASYFGLNPPGSCGADWRPH